MPEISEVRWLVKNLQKELNGVQLLSAKISHKSVIQGIDDETFKDLDSANDYISNAITPDPSLPILKFSFVEVDRRGKFLLLTLKRNNKSVVLLSHLGFTGWWVPSWAEITSPRRFLHPMGVEHTKILFETSRGQLHLTDPRALSRLRIYPSKDAALYSRHLKKMGPDADSDDGILAYSVNIPRTGQRIRTLLMDQQVASGVGNYLCCEILYRAKLNGHEKANRLSPIQTKSLYEAIRETIKRSGVDDDVNWWSVFQKKNCPLGHEVTREEWANRGHYLCYTCQGRPS